MIQSIEQAVAILEMVARHGGVARFAGIER